MRAIRVHTFGGPEVLERDEAPTPEPGPGQALVRVVASGVNPADWKIRSGLVPRYGPPPLTLGLDVSGVVERVGPGVTAFRPGDEVVGAPMGGGYAQHVVVAVDALAAKPPGVDHVTAAALPVAGLTAWQALTEAAQIRAGDRVLVHAAAGGVGHLAVQIAKHRGGYVIGTAGAANRDFLRGLGADEVVDHRSTDFATAVRDAHAVLDMVGGDYGPRSLDVLRPNGILVSVSGSGSARLVTPEIAAARGRRYTEFPMHPSGADLAALLDLVAAGTLRVNVADTMPWTDAAEAHRRSESGRVRGKLVLTH
ncbi:MAG TPA: NADP-dependent oxidoreductase [Actinocatenispora sp.]